MAKKKLPIHVLEASLPDGTTYLYRVYSVAGGIEVIGGPNFATIRLHEGVRTIDEIRTEIAGWHKIGFDSVKEITRRRKSSITKTKAPER